MTSLAVDGSIVFLAVELQGISEPQKICVPGNRNGGYLALEAAATEPDKFRCVVSINGPINVDFLRPGGTFSDLSESDAHLWPHSDEESWSR